MNDDGNCFWVGPDLGFGDLRRRMRFKVQNPKGDERKQKMMLGFFRRG